MRNIIKTALILGSLTTAAYADDAAKKPAEKTPATAKDAPKADAKKDAPKADAKDATKDAPKTDTTKTPAKK